MKARPRERDEGPDPKRPTLVDLPFRRLIAEDEELLELRREYESLPAKRRRQAAVWQYEASLATQLFNEAIGRVPGGTSTPEGADLCPGAVLALAIDPQCAPALLTVGSVEFQLGRVEEGMELFLTLTTLPADTEDLLEIIDEVADFLIEREEYERLGTLYASGVRHHPEVGLYHSGLGYCAGKLGQLDQAVEHTRRAVELEPENHRFLSDLGWSLMETERYDEAEEFLVRAVRRSPADDDLASNGLEELYRRRKLQNRKS